MQRSSIFFTIIIVFAVIVCYQSVAIFKLNSQKQVSANSVDVPTRDSVRSLRDFKFDIENESSVLNNSKVYFANDTASSFKFFDKKKNGKYLVFRFSGMFCDKCIDDIVKILRSTFPDFAKNDNIILLGSEINPRIKVSYYGKQLLSYTSSDFGIPFEKASSPFFFVIDNDNIVKLFFIPETDKPEKTAAYLRIIKHRFF